jgi:hypothetical protein
MGIISSPHPLYMLEAFRRMGDVIDPELQEPDRQLTLTFRRYLTVRELQLRVSMVAGQLDESRPKGKSRASLLELFHINWPQRKAVMLREFLGTSELMTRDDS